MFHHLEFVGLELLAALQAGYRGTQRTLNIAMNHIRPGSALEPEPLLKQGNLFGELLVELLELALILLTRLIDGSRIRSQQKGSHRDANHPDGIVENLCNGPVTKVGDQEARQSRDAGEDNQQG